MYDHCLTKEVKEWARERLWNFAKSRKVVVHDYNSPQLFQLPQRDRDDARELQDGLYAWRINATGNDWEFGFAENAKGDYSTNRKGLTTPARVYPCSQRLKFFNRNIN